MTKKRKEIKCHIPDYGKWNTRIADKILPHLLIFENTEKVHDAIGRARKKKKRNSITSEEINKTLFDEDSWSIMVLKSNLSWQDPAPLSFQTRVVNSES